jgi:hypothetical protein
MCTADDPRMDNLNKGLYDAIFYAGCYTIPAERYATLQKVSDILSGAVSPLLVMFLVTFAKDTGPSAPGWVKPTWGILLFLSSVAAFAGTIITWLSRALNLNHKRYICLRIKKGAEDTVESLKNLRADILTTTDQGKRTQLFDEAGKLIAQLHALEHEATTADVQSAQWMQLTARQASLSQVLNIECSECAKTWKEGSGFLFNKRQAKRISKGKPLKGKKYCKSCGSDLTLASSPPTGLNLSEQWRQKNA